MKLKNKIFLMVGLLVLLSGGLAACGKNKEESTKEAANPKEVRIGIIRVPNDKQVAIQQDFFKKYFDDKGIKTSFMFFDSGVAANQAFASGSIDFAEMGYTNGVVACATELPVELIWIHEVLGENEALVAQKELGATSVEDLRGKKIATPFSSTSHLSLLKALEEAKIEDDVTILDMETAEIVAAWERGDIDAAYTWEPTLSKIKETGDVLIDSRELAEKGYLTANIDLVHKDFSEKYPNLVRDYLLALNEAVELYKDNPEKAAQAAADALEITEEDALSQMKATEWLTLEEQVGDGYLGTSDNPGKFHDVFYDTAVFLKEQGSIKRVPDEKEVNRFISSKYVELALEK
ncbi:taurine ABC transporter substrate-binding protein [Vagococcus elongatus]|uniref:Taurine ABC transporter substrate-binding protein n=1 Tax=Vagococcus elongatus TaxID=180344 RepID=A0A430B5G7_9ENTE|nr:ABC transporter substrate-binding protein [Vagococcus elongatus]RSU15539.1 taurine ABC transporter substrate-binding protein [Vagococcus elongatus]